MECTKIKLTELEAKLKLVRIHLNSKLFAKNDKRRVRQEKKHYLCPYCNSWHLTSQSNA